jgi:glyoxylase-like metal-dependent hydrolase (beta-lactamase superfamily II)
MVNRGSRDAMQRERVADDIYIFTSDLYAQVTAGLVVTSEGAILIDTLVFPEETLQIRRFVENRLKTTVRYLVNTHFHADHTTGSCFFPEAQIVSHALCRELLDTRGRESLARAKTQSPELRDVELVLPTMLFRTGTFQLYLGEKSLQMWHTPGHSPDSIVCLVKEDRVLFAADTVMPLPYFVDGSYTDFLASLASLQNGNYENVVQGHGEVILRGEIEEKLQGDMDYLTRLLDHVDHALNSRTPEKSLQAISPERCGKSRILLNGAVEQLHRNNVTALANQRRELVQL